MSFKREHPVERESKTGGDKKMNYIAVNRKC